MGAVLAENSTIGGDYLGIHCGMIILDGPLDEIPTSNPNEFCRHCSGRYSDD
jgi:hypothetical protein